MGFILIISFLNLPSARTITLAGTPDNRSNLPNSDAPSPRRPAAYHRAAASPTLIGIAADVADLHAASDLSAAAAASRRRPPHPSRRHQLSNAPAALSSAGRPLLFPPPPRPTEAADEAPEEEAQVRDDDSQSETSSSAAGFWSATEQERQRGESRLGAAVPEKERPAKAAQRAQRSSRQWRATRKLAWWTWASQR